VTENSSNITKPQLPNSATVLVLGILSILISCFFIGLILGIIGLVLSKEGRTAYSNDPDKFSGYGVLNAGRVLCIIGIILGGISLFYFLTVLAIGGTILGILSQIITW
jgi:hypothetical protein